MISYNELGEAAKTKGISLYNADKDYLQDILLLLLYRNTKRDLVFKGGTALCKCYRLPRFSEDLDFTSITELSLEKILEILAKTDQFGIKFKAQKATENRINTLLRLSLEGPLYHSIGRPSRVRLDISKRAELCMDPTPLVYKPLYSDIPQFQILVMPREEILAEKVRALITRDAARDLYDLSWLIETGTAINKEMINLKLRHYDREFNNMDLKAAILNKKGRWDADLKNLGVKGADFAQTSRIVLKAFGIS